MDCATVGEYLFKFMLLMVMVVLVVFLIVISLSKGLDRRVPRMKNPPPPPEKRCNGPEVTQFRNGNTIVRCASRKKNCHCSWTETLKFIK